jgi:hypothetical protein
VERERLFINSELKFQKIVTIIYNKYKGEACPFCFAKKEGYDFALLELSF